MALSDAQYKVLLSMVTALAPAPAAAAAPAAPAPIPVPVIAPVFVPAATPVGKAPLSGIPSVSSQPSNKTKFQRKAPTPSPRPEPITS